MTVDFATNLGSLIFKGISEKIALSISSLERFYLGQNSEKSFKQCNSQPCKLVSIEVKSAWQESSTKEIRIDPTKISGPYPLLAVMLLVAEILFAIWFYKSQSSTERTIAGSIMALVFISLMIFVLRMNRTTDQEKKRTISAASLLSYTSYSAK